MHIRRVLALFVAVIIMAGASLTLVAQKVDQLRHRTPIDTSTPPHIAALPLRCASRPGGNACPLSQLPTAPPDRSFQGMVQGALEPGCLK